MKRIVLYFIVLALLSGCKSNNNDLDRAMELRTKMNQGQGCVFEADITADYGDKIYQFTLSCIADQKGNVTFKVLMPKTIEGITGRIDHEGGKLIFDDATLAFELQADGMLSPVSAPWIMVRALTGGYVRSCCKEESMLRLTVDDSYQEDALMLDIWLNEDNIPIRADLYEVNRRILVLEIKNFKLL